MTTPFVSATAPAGTVSEIVPVSLARAVTANCVELSAVTPVTVTPAAVDPAVENAPVVPGSASSSHPGARAHPLPGWLAQAA